MTDQQKLSSVWAGSNSGVEAVDDAKYSTGWVAEIPTYQNFNYVLQTTTKNILAHAEKDAWAWENDVTYAPGGKVIHNNVMYFCIVEAYNIDPTVDFAASRNYWTKAPAFGSDTSRTTADARDTSHIGLHIDTVDVSTASNWTGHSATVTAVRPGIALNTTGTTDNHILSNVNGYLCTMNVDNVAVPDNRVTTGPNNGVYKIFHEGNPPTLGDVTDGLEEVPQDNNIYGRQWKTGQANAAWVSVSGTVVAAVPPNTLSGSGQGWYNLTDGVHYTDIDDGDSSQWVPSSPSNVPESSSILYDNSVSGLTATTMQEAIDEIVALIEVAHP